MADDQSTEQRLEAIAGRVKAAVAAFNAASEEAVQLGASVTLEQTSLHTLSGAFPWLTVRVSVPVGE